MLDFVLILLGILAAAAGIIGCIIPAIPGPPLNYISLLLLNSVSSNAFTTKFLMIYLALTVLITVLDYVLPIFGAKVFGVSKYGIWGSAIGMLIGLIFFPPFGMILGLILGAFIGELAAGKDNSEALRAGAASFALSMLMILLKLALSLIMTFYFIKESINYLF